MVVTGGRQASTGVRKRRNDVHERLLYSRGVRRRSGQRNGLLALARLAVAGLAVVAITYQYAKLDGAAGFSAGNFFGFFTIQSNLLAVAVLVAAAVVPASERSPLFDAVRSGVTLFVAITGVVFAVLLAGLQEELQTTIPWVDTVVHRIVPLAVVVDWVVDRPLHRLPARVAAAWLAYPAAWFAITLVRGASVDWYPYPFVDVGRHGYARVLLNAVVLLACFTAAALALWWLGNRRAAPAQVRF